MKTTLCGLLFAILFTALLCYDAGKMYGASNKINLQQQSSGIAVFVDGKLVGNAVSFNFASGSGLVQVCVPAGAQVTCTPSYNSIATKQSIQKGDAIRCVSSVGIQAYKCSLNPAGTVSTIVPGVELEFVPDVPCAAAQSCTLAVDSAAALTIKANDGGSGGAVFAANGHIVHRLAADLLGSQLVWRLVY